jgi:hypothetical protein
VAFDFTGIDLEKVYQKLIKAFITSEVSTLQNFEEVVAVDTKIKNLEKDIGAIGNKIRSEKQFNRKVELNKILLARKKELKIVTTNHTKSTK